MRNRGPNRQVVFRAEDDYAYFWHLLERYGERFPLRLYHDCLMSHHFPLLVDGAHPRDWSPGMAGLLRSQGHYFHRRYAFVGHLGQGRFPSPAVAVEDYFLSCARYSERHPLTAGVETEPWGYRWSSCRAQALGVQDAWLSYHVWYRDLAPEAARRQQRWREFLLGDDPQEEAVGRGDGIEGSEAQRRRMQRAEARPARRGGRPRKPPPGQEGFFPEFYETTRDP